jgi:hypothetical protein
MPYTCHLCADAEPATVLITPLAGGDTMAIGSDCMVTGLCGLLSVATQVDPEQLYDHIIKLRQEAEAELRLSESCPGCAHPWAQHLDNCTELECACRLPRPADLPRPKAQRRSSRAKPAQVPESQAAPA